MKACANYLKCNVSTGIHEGLTFGSGRLTFNGYWEFPCYACARTHERLYPADGECWPFKGQDVLALTKDIQEELSGEEDFYG